jgi:hypothetical protein
MYGETACPERPALFVAQQPRSGNGTRTIQRVMITNRGEIACRVIVTELLGINYLDTSQMPTKL